MKKIILTLTLALILSGSGFSQNYWLKKTYPKLSFNTLLQSPVSNASEKQFDGKTVVLEFWATWCSPCLANVPHINEVQQHFANDTNVVFISITDESKQKIEPFLKKRKLNGWIACDVEREIHKAYGVSGIPKTFIINTKGIVVYDGRPEKLTTTIIEQIKAGEYTPVPIINKDKKKVNLFGSWSGGEDPVFTANFSTEGRKLIPFQHTIRPSVMPNMGGSGWRNSGTGAIGITILNVSIEKALALLMDLNSFKRVANHSKVDKDKHWDIIFSRTRDYTMEKAQKEIIASLTQTLDFNFKDTVIPQTVLIASIDEHGAIFKNEASINWDDPTTKSLRKLSDLLNTLEERGDLLISLEKKYEDVYLDTFGDMQKLYKMNDEELKKWLEGKGVSFSKSIETTTTLWLY